MCGGWSEWSARDRMARNIAEAEERRLARLAAENKPRRSPRAWAARRLFAFAVALQREETWRIVWERLEAPRRP